MALLRLARLMLPAGQQRHLGDHPGF